ncbi:hypothetical protein CFIO01_01691 [Colletotrichum fioriniae PJ7]|uniref:Uncharacterized protein n=1 Tax=Colletotrichum fioriniae PJ7 TaxID=1445577 RepID=A0A010RGT1_9PEZI|nr:hypothetical protein CFIO01_01691 [Colletotrichum fioriniae PJ7]
MAQTAGASELWNATDECPSPSPLAQDSAKKPPNKIIPADDDAQTGLQALRALPSISTNPMGLLSRPPPISSSHLHSLSGPRPSFH